MRGNHQGHVDVELHARLDDDEVRTLGQRIAEPLRGRHSAFLGNGASGKNNARAPFRIARHGKRHVLILRALCLLDGSVERLAVGQHDRSFMRHVATPSSCEYMFL
jgi:hypothetical protein